MNVPEELRQRDRWLPHSNKVPIDLRTGSKTDYTNHDVLVPYEEAAAYADTHGLDGVEYILAEDDPFFLVDQDKCRDPKTGVIDETALEIIAGLDTYTEISSSGTGLHSIGKGRIPGNRNRKGNVEIYDRARPVVFTGNHLPDTPVTVNDRQFALEGLYHRVFGSASEADKAADLLPPPTGLSKDQVVAKLRTAKNRDKFMRLWSGDISGYDSNSEARAALIRLAGFYAGGEVDLVESILRESGLEQTKWDGRRGDTTLIRYDIRRVLAEMEEVYTPKGDEGQVHGEDNSFQPNIGIPPEKKDLQFKTVQELEDEAGEEPPWIATPYVVRGAITDLAGPAKRSGKTTLITHMLRRVLDGSPFLGETTEKAAVVFMSEQGNNLIEPLKKAGLHERNENLRILQWRDTAGYKWSEIVAAVREKVEEVKGEAGLPVVLVVDTVNRFAGLTGEKENNAGDVMEAMNPLLSLAQELDIAIITIRHANKEGGPRGSTAFEHDVDILLTMGRPLGGYGPNVREIKGVGRYDGIPDTMLVELTEDGYKPLGSSPDAAFKLAVTTLRSVTPENEESATKEEDLLEEMNKEADVSRSTGQRAIRFLYDKEKELKRIGEGKKGNPYRYYLPKWIPRLISHDSESVSAQPGGVNGEKRTRGEKEAANIPEASTVDGIPEEWSESEPYFKVRETLARLGAATSDKVASKTGLSPTVVREVLDKGLRGGAIVKLVDGQYRLANPPRKSLKDETSEQERPGNKPTEDKKATRDGADEVKVEVTGADPGQLGDPVIRKMFAIFNRQELMEATEIGDDLYLYEGEEFEYCYFCHRAIKDSNLARVGIYRGEGVFFHEGCGEGGRPLLEVAS